MSMKLCGLDINGWRDFVAKNWRTVPGQEEELGPIEIVPSGPLTAVVNVGNGKRSTWIGGAQADAAPHGFGGGWGAVGVPERRVAVRSLLEMADSDITKLVACFAGSAQGASYNVLSIDEGPDGSEVAQEHFLEALSVGKYRNASLVWRPVLAALYAIDHGLVREGQRVAVVYHDRRGLAVQQLLIRSARGVLAPERKEDAKHAPSDIGYASLVRAARFAAIGPDGLSSRTAHRAIARSVGKVALGIQCQPEILRIPNGDWEILDLSSYNAPVTDRALEGPLDLGKCDIVLFETLTEGKLKESIVTNIESAVRKTVLELPPQAVAQGALLAARRAASGEPVFFDFLPRLSTIVYGSDGAINFDLIRPEETLEAGRTYRSPQPASLAIPAGQESVSVYLRKEAAPPSRKANVAIGMSLTKQAAVSLWVEQKPAAGRARILMEAPSLGRNFTVDWDHAKEDPRPWEEIIESLQTSVSIPRRLILPCGMQPWEDSTSSTGMLSLLKSEAERSAPDWKTLASKLVERPFGQYCISSDGHLPKGLGQENIDRVNVLTSKAVEVTRSRLAGETGPGTADNQGLKFLTWQFRRCPPEVVTWLIDCIKQSTQSHPFVRHQASWVLVYQGLGRIVQGDDTERWVMDTLLSSEIERWVWNRQTACMAFLLSRSDTAPLYLTRSNVERLARRTIADFRRNIGAEYTMFNYAPFLLAGLLRWRLQNPTALVSGLDPLAADFLAIINEVEVDLASRRTLSANLQRRRNKIIPILRDLKEELLGKGSNPDLLLDIYSST